jgi:hypothetical protein
VPTSASPAGVSYDRGNKIKWVDVDAINTPTRYKFIDTTDQAKRRILKALALPFELNYTFVNFEPSFPSPFQQNLINVRE